MESVLWFIFGAIIWAGLGIWICGSGIGVELQGIREVLQKGRK